MYLGWLLPVLVLVPNILFLKFPPLTTSTKIKHTSQESKLMEAIERIGQVGVFVIPFFYQTYVETLAEMLCIPVMMVSLMIYYVGWARYFSKDRQQVLLYKPLMGMPLPLVISPIIFFLTASVFLSSGLLFVFALILGDWSHIHQFGTVSRMLSRSRTAILICLQLPKKTWPPTSTFKTSPVFWALSRSNEGRLIS